MPSISLVLRLLPYIAVAGFIWWALDVTYTRAQDAEIAKCESEKAKADIDAMKELGKLRKELEKQQEKSETRAMQIIGAYANEIEKLHNDLTDAADHRLYITAKTTACEADRSTMSSANKDTGQSDGEIRFEIPTPLEREIRGDYYDAKGLEVKRNTLIEIVETRPDCFEVVQ